MIGLALRAVIFAFRILRPIQREPVAYEPASEVDAIDRAGCRCLPVFIEAYRLTIDGTLGNKSGKLMRRLGAAWILAAVIGPAKLVAFRSIDSPKPNAGRADFDCVAVDYRRLADQVIGQRLVTRQEQRQGNDYPTKVHLGQLGAFMHRSIGFQRLSDYSHQSSCAEIPSADNSGDSLRRFHSSASASQYSISLLARAACSRDITSNDENRLLEFMCPLYSASGEHQLTIL